MAVNHMQSRRVTDEELSAGEFEFQRLQRKEGVPLPCQQHTEWLTRLDDRMWTILLVAAGGAIASLIGLLIQLAHKP